jgi:hypothetical protein
VFLMVKDIVFTRLARETALRLLVGSAGVDFAAAAGRLLQSSWKGNRSLLICENRSALAGLGEHGRHLAKL